VTDGPGIERLLRDLAPQVLGAVVRRYGHFDAAEDAVQEALLAAATQWPAQGVPDHPKGWLITVASRRLTDQLRSDEARRRREAAAAAEPASPASHGALTQDDERVSGRDDTLTLLFLCCHPELTPPSQLALTLRAVAGLSTAEIASAFLVPEPTMAQRISRAKQRIAATGARFTMPPAGEWSGRLQVVLHVLYLMFNEGYAATSGEQSSRPELTGEAIRLTRAVRGLLPGDGEVAGLLALMLLTEARRPARCGPDGALVPLAEQDRTRWNRDQITEGLALVTGALTTAPLGAYQLQAAIAAVHTEAATAAETDWRQILALYNLLERITPSPVITLNRAVAVAMVDGPQAALRLLASLETDERMAGHHRLTAVRAHCHELAGDRAAAAGGYADAARAATSLPERRYLEARAAELVAAKTHGAGAGQGLAAEEPRPGGQALGRGQTPGAATREAGARAAREAGARAAREAGAAGSA
jgi:RNA polymerase sigma factor (sigma-70 family)